MDGVPSESPDGLGYLEHQPTLISIDGQKSVIVDFARRLDVKNVPLH
jgi:hypothetical protein